MISTGVAADLIIGMSAPDIGEREIQLAVEVLRSGVLSIGPMVERFEVQVAARIGVRHAVAISSGTAGLHACLIAAGVGPGDEVVTTSFSFAASANAVRYERARPVFVDIDPATLNIDPGLIERAITPRTRAILPVHVFGEPADMDPIREIAQRHGLAVIEDACEAIGAEYRGRPTGALGDAGVFAFYPNKQITTAEGGMIVTDRDDLAALYRSLRNHGRDVFDGWLQHSRLGYNYRMSELHAALGVAQMERLDELLGKRARVAAAYHERLSRTDYIEAPAAASTTTRASWFVYVVRLDIRIDRDAVIERLRARGIPSRPYFPPIHLQRHYREAFGHRAGDLPVTEREASRTLALPFHANVSEADIDRVCDALAHAVY
jgi:perosamine synthetase